MNVRKHRVNRLPSHRCLWLFSPPISFPKNQTLSFSRSRNPCSLSLIFPYWPLLLSLMHSPEALTLSPLWPCAPVLQNPSYHLQSWHPHFLSSSDDLNRPDRTRLHISRLNLRRIVMHVQIGWTVILVVALSFLPIIHSPLVSDLPSTAEHGLKMSVSC